MPLILPISANEIIDEEISDYYTVSTMPLHGPLSQWKRYETLFSTQTDRDNLLITNTIDQLLSLYYPWLDAGGYFSLDNLSILCFWLNWYCANEWHGSLTLSKQMLALDKIFTTVSSTTFVHIHR